MLPMNTRAFLTILLGEGPFVRVMTATRAGQGSQCSCLILELTLFSFYPYAFISNIWFFAWNCTCFHKMLLMEKIWYSKDHITGSLSVTGRAADRAWPIQMGGQADHWMYGACDVGELISRPPRSDPPQNLCHGQCHNSMGSLQRYWGMYSYRITHHAAPLVLLTSNQKLCVSVRSIY